MTGNSERKVNLLISWDVLQKNADETHALNAGEICEKLETYGINVIRRVVANDIATLDE